MRIIENLAETAILCAVYCVLCTGRERITVLVRGEGEGVSAVLCEAVEMDGVKLGWEGCFYTVVGGER